MCRSIRILRTPEGPAGDPEVAEAARQFVRKISGMREPAARNLGPFEDAVAEITATSVRLLAALPPRRVRPKARAPDPPS